MPPRFYLLGDILNRSRAFLTLFCAVLFAQMLISYGRQLRYFRSRPARIYGPPPRLLGRIGLPSLTPTQFGLLGVVIMASLLAATMNFFPRSFLLVALLSYFLYFNPIMSLAFVQRKTNLIPIVLLVLALAPGIYAPFEEAAPLWPLFLIKCAVAMMYLSAGVQKLRQSGLKWCDGKNLQAYLVEHFLWGDTKRALVLAQHPRLCSVLSTMLLFFELTFWVVLVCSQLTLLYVIAGVAFHLGTALTMRINYLKYLSPVYLVFLPDITMQLKRVLVR